MMTMIICLGWTAISHLPSASPDSPSLLPPDGLDPNKTSTLRILLLLLLLLPARGLCVANWTEIGLGLHSALLPLQFKRYPSKAHRHPGCLVTTRPTPRSMLQQQGQTTDSQQQTTQLPPLLPRSPPPSPNVLATVCECKKRGMLVRAAKKEKRGGTRSRG